MKNQDNFKDNQDPYFMNRVRERKEFKNIQEGKKKKRILLYLTDAGEGKSTLLYYLYQRSLNPTDQKKPVPSVWVDFDSTFREKISYRKLAYRIIDELRPWIDHDSFTHTLAQLEQRALNNTYFNSLQNPTLNGYGSSMNPMPVDPTSPNMFNPANNIVYNGIASENADLQEQLKDTIGRAFRDDLNSICNQHPIVLFFDTFEDASSETRAWIEEWIFDYLYRYPQLTIVIAGTPEPDLVRYFDHSRPWKPLIQRNMSLSIPTEEDIRDYMAHYDIDTDDLHLFWQAALLNMEALETIKEWRLIDGQLPTSQHE